MKKKKLLSVLLTAAMLTGILGGCGSEPAKGYRQPAGTGGKRR